ncbi:MAG TPA: hypothetical protein VGM37_03575 [Armatimonadota bacterium]
MMKVLVALVLLAGVAATAAVETDDHHIVRPGEGIGVIKLGMTVPQVHEAMETWGAKSMMPTAKGTPGAWLDSSSGAAIEPYQTDSLGQGRFGNVMKVFYVKNRVAQIAVQSVAYTTTKGGMARLTSQEFRSLHPSLHPIPVQETWGGKVRAYDSERLGLAVTYNMLRSDLEARTAQEIFVHNSGSPVILEAPHAVNAAKSAEKKDAAPNP